MKKKSKIYSNNNLFDSNGYLKNYLYWNKIIAIEIAKKESINLTINHWEIILFIRNFYLKFKITPSMKMLSKSLKLKFGNKKSNSIYLYKLFPKGAANQASKIAGIPKPNHCL
ncbi:Sulfurtransferase TusE [Buchnera aphidicola (Tetraneura ulmi)]|uniref:TusE/DsrC/DsvC family sulfur relay protein n=1 Tax=Buchnera aphidicola TaxID=9 RepID=UPI003464B60D